MILVRPFTEADDVAGFHAAKGILTSRGRQGARTRRWWRAGWGGRRWSAPSALEIDLERARRSASTARRSTRAT